MSSLSETTAPNPTDNAESVRRRLRAMMEPSHETSARRGLAAPAEPAPVYPGLRAAALTGIPALFQTALADALEIDFRRARDVFSSGYFDLLAALRALGLTAEQAYVLTAAAYPAKFPHAEAIRLFLERFALLHVEAARDRVRGWKAASITAAIGVRPMPVNDGAGVERKLKAS